jgi:hypothetical protein
MFQAPKLTNAGKALYYDNIGGEGITFTTIKMGKGTLAQSIALLTDLVDTVVTITAALSKGSENTYVDIGGAFSNAGLTDGFYWKEIGVFAADPDFPTDRTKDILFCYQNAYDTADFIRLLRWKRWRSTSRCRSSWEMPRMCHAHSIPHSFSQRCRISRTTMPAQLPIQTFVSPLPHWTALSMTTKRMPPSTLLPQREPLGMERLTRLQALLRSRLDAMQTAFMSSFKGGKAK